MRKLIIGLAILAVPTVAFAASNASKVSIHATARTITYGNAVKLYGNISPAKSGEKVYLLSNTCGSKSAAYHAFTSTKTVSQGKWAVRVRPKIRMGYQAKWKTNLSGKLGIYIRPRLNLAQTGAGSFRIRAYAAQSLEGKVAVFQRWINSLKQWKSYKYVTLRFIMTSSDNVTKISGASFTAAVAKNTKLRVVISTKQVQPCYVGGSSPTITAS